MAINTAIAHVHTRQLILKSHLKGQVCFKVFLQTYLHMKRHGLDLKWAWQILVLTFSEQINIYSVISWNCFITQRKCIASLNQSGCYWAQQYFLRRLLWIHFLQVSADSLCCVQAKYEFIDTLWYIFPPERVMYFLNVLNFFVKILCGEVTCLWPTWIKFFQV